MKNVLLVNAPLTILFLSATYGGRVHDKDMVKNNFPDCLSRSLLTTE